MTNLFQANESQSLNYGCIAEDPETHKVMQQLSFPSSFILGRQSSFGVCLVYHIHVNIRCYTMWKSPGPLSVALSTLVLISLHLTYLTILAKYSPLTMRTNSCEQILQLIRGKNNNLFLSLNYSSLLSPDYARDRIDLDRSVLTPLSEAGKLYVYKMKSGFWCQVKTAG